MQQAQDARQHVARRRMYGLMVSTGVLFAAMFAALQANQKRIARIPRSEPAQPGNRCNIAVLIRIA
jgi:prolipoprotein diacylglyceryltransferase